MTPRDSQRIDPLYRRWESGAISGISIQRSLSHCPSVRPFWSLSSTIPGIEVFENA